MWRMHDYTTVDYYFVCLCTCLYLSVRVSVCLGGTAASAPPPFRPGNPALCGSCPLVTPYYCRLGDLLCYNCMLYLSYDFVCMHVYFVFSLFSGLFSFVDFPSVLWYCWLGLLTCKNRLPYNLYCVEIKPYSTINQLISLVFSWDGCCLLTMKNFIVH